MHNSHVFRVSESQLDSPRPAARSANDADERVRFISRMFSDHRRALRSFIGRFVQNEDDIADTVQEVFVRISRLPDPHQLDANPRAFLFTTAEHLVYDRMRRDKCRHVQSHDTLDNHEIECRSATPEQRAEWHEAVEQISTALMKAGSRVSDVVELSFLHDLTHPEIAQRLGVTIRTVERCMNRARQVCHGRRDLISAS